MVSPSFGNDVVNMLLTREAYDMIDRDKLVVTA